MEKNYFNEDFLRILKGNMNHDWNLENNLVLLGCISLFESTNQTVFKDFVLDFSSKSVDENGNISFLTEKTYSMDCISFGVVLMFSYRNTTDNRYKKAISLLADT